MDDRDFRSFMDGGMPAWLSRLLSRMEGTALRYGLLAKGDRVMAGLSGGKDSLCLLLLLALSRRRPQFDFALEACLVDWEEAAHPGANLEAIQAYCAAIGVPLSVLRSPLPHSPGKNDFSCYLCARARKSLVFAEAARRGFGTVAFGHHLDDAMATALMNCLGHGRAEPLPPSREFFCGAIRVVRPLIDVPEASLAHAARRLLLPVSGIDCPHRLTNERDRLRPLLAELRRFFPRGRENLVGLSRKSLNDTRIDVTVGEGR